MTVTQLTNTLDWSNLRITRFLVIADNLSSFAWSFRFLILVFSSFAILFSSQIGAFDFARLNLLFLEIKLAQHSWGSSVALWTLKRARHLFFFPSKPFNERPSKEEVEWWAEPFSDATSSWSSLRMFVDFIENVVCCPGSSEIFSADYRFKFSRGENIKPQGVEWSDPCDPIALIEPKLNNKDSFWQ